MKNLQRNTFGLIAIIYCLGMIYQLILVTHFQINKEEITKNHCVNVDKPEMKCNGKCHLKKEILKTSVSSEGVEENSNNYSPSLYFVAFSQNLMYQSALLQSTGQIEDIVYISSRVNKTVSDISLPPPQVIY